jgi:ATP-dependent Lon protease
VVKLTEKYKNFSSFLLDYLAPQINLQAAIGEALRLPNFCLVGPPGIGKTAMLSELAEVLGIGSDVFDASSLQASHVFNGLSRNFATADFGLIFKTMMLEKSHQTGELRPANALICLDEVEKVGKSDHYGSILDLMLTLLEQRTAARFVDAALPELPLNLSALNWCFTSNSLDALSAPLRSRLIAIDIPPPTHEQSIEIAASIFAERIERIVGRIPNTPDLLFDDLERLAAFPPRQQKQLIEHGIARAVWEERDTVVIEANVASLAHRKIGFL